MWRATIAGIMAHARRFAATAIAVGLGVGLVAGTLIFTDTAQAGFYDTFARVARNVDVSVIRPSRVAGVAPTRLRESDLDSVRAVPGVAAADGRVTESLALLDRTGRPITNFGRTGLVMSSDSPAGLRAFDITGRVPGPNAEAAIDTQTAAHQRLAVGDTITVLDRAGVRHPLRLTGLIDFGVSTDYADSTVVALPHAEIAHLTGSTGYDEVVVAAQPGVSPADLAERIRAVVEPSAQVETGEERRADLADEAAGIGGQFTAILLLFAAISLVVAVFVIHNTFTILLAQRVRQTALLRCVGAGRAQVFWAAAGEAAVVGLTGAASGVLAGIGVAYGLQHLLDRLVMVGVPSHSLVVTPSSLAIGLFVGLAVAVVAALRPAWRASRTSPLGALRDLPSTVSGRRAAVIRLAAAGLVLVAGLAMTASGWRADDPKPATLLIAGGAVLAVGAVLIAAPLFIGSLMTALARPLRPVAGVPGRLAAAHARANPGRTAAATATLMIGIGLISLFSVIIASVKATAHDQITNRYPVDYAISGLSYHDGRQSPLPRTLASALRARPELAAVAEVRTIDVTVDGHPAHFAAVDPAALGTIVRPHGYQQLTDDTVIVSTSLYASPTAHPAAITAGSSGPLRIIGVTDLALPGTSRIDALVTWNRLTALGSGDADTEVLAKAAPHVPPTASRDAVDQATAHYPLAQVNSVADLTSSLNSAVDGLIALFAGLVATSVLIALSGIANTLSLSVVERTRESATLRALGLTRRQLESTLLVEAILMAAVGAITGIAFGLTFGVLVAEKSLATLQPAVAIPWAWLAALVAGAAVAGGAAAVLPARKAAQASIVAAMTEV